MRDLDDAILLEHVLRRSDAAWRELMSRFRSRVFCCIQRAVGPNDADDAFGEFCVSILADDMHRLRAWDPSRGARLCSWLCMLAIKAAFDHRRRITRFERPAPPPPANDGDALSGILDREERAQLAALVATTSARDQELFDLFYADELDTEVVAGAMCVSIKTVYSKKNKLIARLRRAASAEAA